MIPEQEQEQEQEQYDEVQASSDHPAPSGIPAPYGPEMSMADYHYLERASRTGRW